MAWLTDSQPQDARTDEQLAKAYHKSANAAVLGVLYGRYLELIYGVCLHYLQDAGRAEDAVMDIYVQLQFKLETQQIENFRPWLYRLSRNHCLMILRRSASQLTLTSSSVATNASADIGDMQFHDFLHLREDEEAGRQQTESMLDALNECTDQLAGDQAACIRKFYLLGESYAEIADNLNLTLGQVRSCIQNGRRNLKLCVERKTQHAEQ